jgi:tetratricopeptide (TPR) repeat protein
MKHRRIYFVAVLSSLILLPAIAVAQHAGHSSGAANFPVSCTPAAQTEFNRAVTLLHHMTYPQARTSFRRVAEIDPKCAMAHWGVAMTFFQPLWPTRPSAELRAQGWEAVEKAKALQPQDQREQLFIAATEAFYLDPAADDYWRRIRRWEQAMEKVYQAFPDDPEAATFYALAHLATTPADKVTRANADRAAEILLSVYRKNPNHPGAMHYLVHANDVPGRERELLEITRKYDSIAPNNPHAIHMPTHIYVRLGDWNGVIQGNLRAARAALLYPAGDQQQYVWDEFCHAIEYLIYAYLQKGNYAAAAAQLHRLRTTEHLEPSFKTAFHLMSTQARYVLERHDWAEATRMLPRQRAELNWDRATWPEGIAHFTRGLGFAHLGKLTEAKAENDQLNALEAKTQKMGEDLFARNIRMLRLELSAWISHVEAKRERFEGIQERPGLEDRAVTLMREAAELEKTTPKAPVTPGPTIPAEELLGDLLMEQKKYSEALAAYQRSLALYPKRWNSVLGSARASRMARR